MRKVAVLCSSGIDSTTCLALAMDMYDPSMVVMLTVNYGQKAWEHEYDGVIKMADAYGLSFHVIDETYNFIDTKNPLLKGKGTQVLNNQFVETIPFRNGLFVSAAAVTLQSLYPDQKFSVWLGANAESVDIPDTRKSFVKAIDKAVRLGTSNMISVKAPLVKYRYNDVIRLGFGLGALYKYSWSCFLGLDKPCGVCSSCKARAIAFKELGYIDPYTLP